MRVVLLALLFVTGCKGGTPKPLATPTASPEPSAVQSAAASDAPPLPMPVGSANPSAFDGVEGDDLARFETRHVGFTADDAYLGYEISTCDPCSNELHFTSPTQPPIDLAYYYEPREENAAKQAKQDAEVDRRIKQLGIGTGRQTKLRGPFPFPDLVFASKTDHNDVTGIVTLLFGARVEGYAPVFPMRVDLGPGPMFNVKTEALETRMLSEPSLWYANVTKDGSDIGVVAVATGVMWFETAGVARMSARSFAAQVYNDTAMRLHQSKRYPQAAALFEKAEIASPTESLFSYNLACAFARAKDPRAKDALGRAIQHGGAAIKTRAQGDADFVDVASDEWFKTLVK